MRQVLWYESGQLRDYAVFAAGAALTSAWFLHHHFWFLEVRATYRPLNCEDCPGFENAGLHLLLLLSLPVTEVHTSASPPFMHILY